MHHRLPFGGFVVGIRSIALASLSSVSRPAGTGAGRVKNLRIAANMGLPHGQSASVRIDEHVPAHAAFMDVGKMPAAVVVANDPVRAADVVYKQHDMVTANGRGARPGVSMRKEPCPIPCEVEPHIIDAEIFS